MSRSLHHQEFSTAVTFGETNAQSSFLKRNCSPSACFFSPKSTYYPQQPEKLQSLLSFRGEKSSFVFVKFRLIYVSHI